MPNAMPMKTWVLPIYEMAEDDDDESVCVW